MSEATGTVSQLSNGDAPICEIILADQMRGWNLAVRGVLVQQFGQVEVLRNRDLGVGLIDSHYGTRERERWDQSPFHTCRWYSGAERRIRQLKTDSMRVVSA